MKNIIKEDDYSFNYIVVDTESGEIEKFLDEHEVLEFLKDNVKMKSIDTFRVFESEKECKISSKMILE
jgi:hypothetical protein